MPLYLPCLHNDIFLRQPIPKSVNAVQKLVRHADDARSNAMARSHVLLALDTDTIVYSTILYPENQRHPLQARSARERAQEQQFLKYQRLQVHRESLWGIMSHSWLQRALLRIPRPIRSCWKRSGRGSRVFIVRYLFLGNWAWRLVYNLHHVYSLLDGIQEHVQNREHNPDPMYAILSRLSRWKHVQIFTFKRFTRTLACWMRICSGIDQKISGPWGAEGWTSRHVYVESLL